MLECVPASHFEQLSGWAAVKCRYGWKVMRIVARHEDRIVGGIQVLHRRLGRLGTIGYVSRGPVVQPGYEFLKPRCVELVEQVATRERWLYLVVDHAYSAHELAASMSARGYHPHLEDLPPSGLMTATVLIDLRNTEEQILAGMRPSSRGHIRRAERSGFSFEPGGAGDLPRFRELMEVICARRGAAPTPPQKDFFQHLWTELAPSNRVRLFVVRKGNEMVCSAFAFTISDTLRVWKVGWSGAFKEECPNYLLWWHAMRWAKTQGFKQFDFVWVDAHDAELVARGETNAAAFRDGTTAFKLSFGGRLLLLPPVQCRFFHPLSRLAHRLGGGRLLASRLFQRALSRYWRSKGN